MTNVLESFDYKNLKINIYPDYDYSEGEAFTKPEPYHTYGRWNGYTLFETEGRAGDWLQHILDYYHSEIIEKYKSLEFSYHLDDYDDPEYTGAPYDREKAESYIEAWIESELIYLPIYVYEHGGITMNTGGYSCRWDSGQAGYIYMSKAEARKNWNSKRVNNKNKRTVESLMESYIKYLAAICEGSIYGFTVEDEDGEVLDSCWGFVETEYPLEKTEVYAEAMASAIWIYKDKTQKHVTKKKAEIKNHVPLLARV